MPYRSVEREENAADDVARSRLNVSMLLKQHKDYGKRMCVGTDQPGTTAKSCTFPRSALLSFVSWRHTTSAIT